MSTYKITSDMTTLGKIGETVTEDDVVGLNVDALISAGHLESVTVNSKKSYNTKEQD